jgi:hypothetical protein
VERTQRSTNDQQAPAGRQAEHRPDPIYGDGEEPF